MFSLSKLLLGGGALVSSGGIASYLVPYLVVPGETLLFQEGDSNSMNFEKLTERAQKLQKQLTEWISKFDVSKTSAQKSKDNEFDKSLQHMSTIQANEESLKQFYELISSKLKVLEEKSTELTSEVEGKLKIQSNLAQIRNVLANLSALIKLLSSWESNISKVIEEFDKSERENQSQGSSGGGTTSQETEGDKARKTLEEAKQQFQKLKENISSVSGDFKNQQLQIFGQDWYNYLNYLSSNVKITWLEQYMQLLNRTVQSTNKDASAKVSELNENNELLRKSHEEWNRLKQWESTFHRFSENFQSKLQSINQVLEKQS